MRRFPVWNGRYLREGRRLEHGFLLRLAGIMAFVAGALNAGGFEMLGLYTSHASGNTSRAARGLAQGDLAAAGSFGILVFTFMAGAFATGLLLSYGKRHRHRARHAFSLGLEALLLLLLGLAGQALGREHLFVPAPALVLAFAMGMHNAASSTVSDTDVRTTHMTGNVTDLGIELSRLLYANRGRPAKAAPILANRRRLLLLLAILLDFFGGAVAGTLAFARYGYACALPLAAILLLLSLPPLATDLEGRLRLYQSATSKTAPGP